MMWCFAVIYGKNLCVRVKDVEWGGRVRYFNLSFWLRGNQTKTICIYICCFCPYGKKHSWVLSGTRLAHRCTKNACHGGLIGFFCWPRRCFAHFPNPRFPQSLLPSISIEHSTNQTVPSRELTYPTLGKGKFIFKNALVWDILVSRRCTRNNIQLT